MILYTLLHSICIHLLLCLAAEPMHFNQIWMDGWMEMSRGDIWFH